jgi:glycosyltransferase involved in cell wall biosynthesis
MRIGIPVKSSGGEFGGPGTYTNQIITHLLRHDEQNEYVLIHPHMASTSSASHRPSSRANVQEVHTRVAPGLVWDQLVVPFVARRYRVDVLFSPFNSAPVWGPFKRVMTVHGAERYVVPGLLNWHALSRWLIMEKFILPRTDAVIAVSETMIHDFCRATGYPVHKTFRTYLAVDETIRRVDDDAILRDLKRRHQLSDDFVLFVGFLFPNKNLGNLLRGFHRVASRIPHQLVITGGRRWKYQGDLALIQELGLEKRVRVLGFVSRDELLGLYSAATCLAAPSLYESFGLAAMEAMACGCPIVASNTGALPEVTGGAATFCDPHDPASIGDAILQLAGDVDVRRSYSEKARARAREFTWERCARETLEVFRGLVDDRETERRPVGTPTP